MRIACGPVLLLIVALLPAEGHTRSTRQGAAGATSSAAAGGSPTSSEMRQLYLDQCSKCHGENGTPTAVGKIGKAPAFADPQWTVPLERAVESIRNGKGRGSSRMPDFKRLGTESIRGLAEYVLSMKQS